MINLIEKVINNVVSISLLSLSVSLLFILIYGIASIIAFIIAKIARTDFKIRKDRK